MPAGSPFAPREALAGKDARTLAREVLGKVVESCRAAFRGSPMKRAKLPAVKRNTVVLGNVGTADDVDALKRALDGPEPIMRAHAAWALERRDARTESAPPLSDADGSDANDSLL